MTESQLDDLPHPELVVAADSGYEAAAALGFAVDVLVGDMDSLATEDIPHHVVVERHPAAKDATDLELALELVARDIPSRVVVVGGSGGRLDHELAVATLLCSARWRSVDELDWRSPRGWAHVVRKRRILHSDVGTTVSLIPIGGAAEGVSTTGLRWGLTGETLAAGTTRGVSNEMVAPVTDIQLSSGCLLVLFPDSG